MLFAKEYKTAERLISIILDLSVRPFTVTQLSQRYGVTSKSIYEYIEWIRTRYKDKFTSSSNFYSINLSETEQETLKKLVE